MKHRLPPPVAERLRALSERPIEPTEKGFGSRLGATAGSRVRVSAASLAAARPSLHAGGFSYPLLTLRDTALRNNVAAMAAFCGRAGVELAPHGKTAMSPELAALQLAHGAWGITVASIGQLQMFRAFGFPRFLLANELVDAAGIAWLAGELAADPGFEAYCYVDSLDGVQILDRALARHRAGRPLPVLVEIGQAGARTGCRTDAAALEVAKAADATDTLRVAGVAGYEGSLGPPWQPETLEAVTGFCRRLRAFADAMAAAGVGAGQDETELIVTAGGSVYYDIAARELTAPGAVPVTAILRSGCYLTHDHGMYARSSPATRGVAGGPDLRPALELWAQVVSRPEPGLALLGAGRRDVGFDAGPPVPLRVLRRDGSRSGVSGTDGWTVTNLNDQHAYLHLPEDAALAPGDVVGFGISHPCTTLDKWRVLMVLNDDDRVIDAVHSFF